MSSITLPNEWIESTLAEICYLNPKNTLADDTEVGFLPMNGVPKSFGEKNIFEIKKWSEVKKGYTHFADGDTIFAKITPCFENSKASIIEKFPNGHGSGSTEYFVLRPIGNYVNPKLLLALVRTNEFLREGAANMSGSVGHKRVPKEFVESFVFPLAPLAEQQQIAQKLDELLAQVDTLKTRLDAIPKILKRFRQSVLAAAVSGRLTEGWRGRDGRQSSKGLVEALKNINSHKAKPYEPSEPPFEVDASWEWARLGDIYLLKSGTTVNVDCELASGDHPYFKVGDMNSPENQFMMVKSGRYVLETSIPKKSLLEKGTIIFPKRGGAISTNKKRILAQKSLVDLNTMGIVVHEPMSVMYTYHWFSNIDLSTLNTGSTIPQINNGDVEPLWVPVPPVEEQTEIVRRVEQLFAYADQIEQRVKDAQVRVNHLTQSILAKAFRGELTADWRAQNPDLISGENSAVALLDRIKAEREATAKSKKKKA